MPRILEWCIGIALGSLTGSAVLHLGSSSHGWVAAAWMAANVLVAAFVTVSVVTALEHLFPVPRRAVARVKVR